MKILKFISGIAILFSLFLWSCADPLPNAPESTIGSSNLNSNVADTTLPIIPPVLQKLVLKVIVDNSGTSDTDKTNVTYIATLMPLPVITASAEKLPIKLIKIDFYTGEPKSTAFPAKYLGSAYVNENGEAILKTYQEPGQYAGGAVWVRTDTDRKIVSNVVIYQVPKPYIPKLNLKVQVNSVLSDDVTRPNVTYTAQVNVISPLSDSDVILPADYMIDFYTGDPASSVFPAKYLGSAPLNKLYTAVLSVLQKPGKYAGGAVWAVSPWGKLISNVVYYQVPEIVKPSIKLSVTVDNNEVDSIYNVVYQAKISNAITAYSEPVILDFYTGNPYVDIYPNEYLGSAQADSTGTALLRVIQKPGKYAGGSIWAKSPWGPIYSNVVYYEVPGAVIPELKLDVAVVNNSLTNYNVVFTAKLSSFISPISEKIKIDFYTGSPVLTVYPSEYLGSGYIDNTGTAVLKVIQKPGQYAGGAIWADTPWGKIFSNVVYYKIPEIILY